MLPRAPAVWIPGPVKSRKKWVDALVETARCKNEPHSKIPKLLRRFFRKQGDQRSNEARTLRQSVEERVSRVASDNAFLKGAFRIRIACPATSRPRKQARRSREDSFENGSGGARFFLFQLRESFSRFEDGDQVADRFYLPFIRKARAGSARRPILDLGCGRGRWLEFLKEESLKGGAST
jgi:hypothetical protein